MNKKRILYISCEDDESLYKGNIEKYNIDEVVIVNRESIAFIECAAESIYYIGNMHWDYIMDLLKSDTRNENVVLLWKNELIVEGKFVYERLLEHSRNSDVTIDKYLEILKEKKIAYVFGNCQSLMIGNGCMKSREFAEEYYLMVSQPVHRLGTAERQQGMNRLILKSLNLFIYQNVSDDNIYSPKLASSYLLNELRGECKKICIPNIYFAGYFPNKKKGINPCVDKAKYGNGLIPYQDILEDELLKGSSLRKVYRKVTDIDSMNSADIQRNFQNSLEKLKKREEQCNIKVSDYIEENYQKEKLFYAVNHPSNSMLKYAIEQILEQLFDKKITINMDEVEPLNIVEELIYPGVKENLELQFPTDKFIFHKKLVNRPLEIFDYIKYYRDSLLRELYKTNSRQQLMNQPIFVRKLMGWLETNGYKKVGLVCREENFLSKMLQFDERINCDIITGSEFEKTIQKHMYDIIIAVDAINLRMPSNVLNCNIYSINSLCQVVCLELERTSLVPDVQKRLYQEKCFKCISLKVEPNQDYYIHKKTKTSRFVVFACKEKPTVGTEVRNIVAATNVIDNRPIRVTIKDEQWMIIYLAAEGFSEMPDIEVW